MRKKRYGHTTEAVLPGKVQAGTAYAAEKVEWNVAHSAKEKCNGRCGWIDVAPAQQESEEQIQGQMEIQDYTARSSRNPLRRRNRKKTGKII